MDEAKKLKVNDRVKRANGCGCLGVVKDIRTEVSTTSAETREKNLMIKVAWDNGTVSYFGPEALEVVQG